MSLFAASTSATFNDELLKLAHSHQTIYEHTRLSGENRHCRRILPVSHPEGCSYALETDYACNMAHYFGEPPTVTRTHSTLVSNQENTLNEALLLRANSRRSIYEKTRLSGENRSTHRVLPTNQLAERTDSCTDTTDQAYANAMTNYFVTKNASRL